MSPFSVGIVVSGMLERTLPEAVQSLAFNVVAPQVEAGAAVFVFVVLQDGTGNKRSPQWSFALPPTADEARSMFVDRLQAAGVCHVSFAVTPALDRKQLSAEYGLDFGAAMARLGRTSSRLAGKWERNLYMYHNLLQGYMVAKGFAVSRFGSSAAFDVVVRARNDNFYFAKHKAYSFYLPSPHEDAGVKTLKIHQTEEQRPAATATAAAAAADVMFPRCREGRYAETIYDKFIIFTNSLASDKFYFILHRHVANLRNASSPVASEILWASEFREAGLELARLDPADFMVSNIAGAPGRTCFRSYDTCVRGPAMKAATEHSCGGNAQQQQQSRRRTQQRQSGASLPALQLPLS